MPARIIPVSDEVKATAAGFCLDCGYSLAGLDRARCPECGGEFDRADPRTFAKRRLRRRVWLWRLLWTSILLALSAWAGTAWLARGWQRELDEIHRLGGPHNCVNVEFEPIGPPLLRRVLGDRHGYLCDRLTDLNLDVLNDERLEDVNFEPFGYLKKLSITHFRLHQKAMDHVGDATQVEELTFQYGRLHVRDGPSLSLGFLSRMSALRVLNIHGDLDETHLGQISGLKQLRVLRVGESGRLFVVELVHLHDLPAMEELELRGRDPVHDELEHLKQFKSLRTLRLPWSKMTSAEIARIQEALPGVTVLTAPSR